jgi:hypothetical protein
VKLFPHHTTAVVMKGFSYTSTYSYLMNIICGLDYRLDSSAFIATGYSVDGIEIVSLWERDFRTHADRPYGSWYNLYIGYLVFLRVKNGRGMKLLPHQSSAVVMKS